MVRAWLMTQNIWQQQKGLENVEISDWVVTPQACLRDLLSHRRFFEPIHCLDNHEPEMVKFQSLIRTRLVRSKLGKLVSKIISTKEEATSFQAPCGGFLSRKGLLGTVQELQAKELSMKEYNRNKCLKSLFECSANQVAQEEFLYVEARKLEQNSLKRSRNREELMKLIGGNRYQVFNKLKSWTNTKPHSIKTTHNQMISKPLSNLTPTTANHIGNLFSHFNNQLKEISGAHLSEDINEDLFPESSHQTNAKEDCAGVDNSKAQLAEDLANCVYRFHQLSSAAQYCTVALRSTRITLPKSSAASSKIYCVMIDLEIPILTSLPKPPIMLTQNNLEAY
ncbi:hypothetical protein PPACK8108_LOCUS20843 [Phakopsora pachyrhizi]|uniref:Uncharacterized protein n=1 Tax=Phakopsora pachyrhizi TaxID=170000 RepID=A0AAV0BGY3_PHAPC|nr:hypothetical protein PPACK8108_LOCUS20843 [Phakopsora pachyrhizi]